MSTVMDLKWCVFALMCCVLQAQVHGEVCDLVSSFLSHFNGHFDTSDQVSRGVAGIDMVDAYIKPVTVPALNSKYVFLLQEIMGGQIVRHELRATTEEPPGVVNMIPYNIISQDYIKFPPEVLELDFSTITSTDIELIQNCSATFVQSSIDSSFTGSWQVCMGGSNTSYTVITQCGEYDAFIPVGAPEAHNTIPYRFVRKEPRFPIPNEPASCASVC